MTRKTKHFVTAYLLFHFFFLYSVASAEKNLPAIVKKISPSVVSIITCTQNGKPLAQGTGFFINEQGHVITSRHVLEGAGRVKIKTASGKIYPLKSILAEDKESDLVRFSVKIPHREAISLSLSKSMPGVGEKVMVIGKPPGLEKAISHGIVSAVRNIPAFGKIIQITAPISPRSSGGPVVTMQGEVLGVATLRIVEGQNLNFALPGERLDTLKPARARTVAAWKAKTQKEGRPEVEGLYRKGQSYLWDGDFKKAIPYFEKTVNKNPHYPKAYFYLGLAYAELGRYQEDLDACQQAISLTPDDAYNIGVAYGKLDRYQEEREACEQAIRLKHDYADAHNNLAVCQGEVVRYQKAAGAFKQAIRLKPDFTEAHSNLGYIYCKLGRYQEAVDAFKQAARLKPDYADAHHCLGVAYLFLGDKDSALAEYKILKDLNQKLANKLFNEIYK